MKKQDVVTNDVQAQAAAEVGADYTKVTGAAVTFGEIAGKIEGERRVKLAQKLERVVSNLRQSCRDNQIGIQRLEKELKEKREKIEYLLAKESELEQAFDSGAIASISELDGFMTKTENQKLSKTVDYPIYKNGVRVN